MLRRLGYHDITERKISHVGHVTLSMGLRLHFTRRNRGKEKFNKLPKATQVMSSRVRIPRLGRSPGEGNGNLTPVFLPGECHGQRSLVDCSPYGRKE